MHGGAVRAAPHEQHHVVRLDVGGRAGAEQLAKVMQRIAAALEFDVPRLVVRHQRLSIDAQDLLDRGRGERDHGRAGAHHDRLRHGEGQRQINGERRAAATGAGDVDAPANRIDLGTHHIHPDAPPGELGDRLRGGKA